MSSKGKRVIFVGPADGAQSKPLIVEGAATEAGILPGRIVQEIATGLEINDTAATVFGKPFLVADKNELMSKSVDDAWTEDDTMQAIQPRSGEFFNAIVADGNNITSPGTALTRNGAGKLAIAATDGTVEIVAYADEIINTTGADALVRCRKA